MLSGFVSWPEELAARYIADGAWRDGTLAELPTRWARTFGSAPALTHRGRRWSYQELSEDVEAVAAGLLRSGIAAQDRVVLQLPNSADFVIAALALSRIGALPVFSLASHRENEIGHLIRLSGATGYICPVTYRGYDHAGLADRIRPVCPTLKVTILVGEAGAEGPKSTLPTGRRELLPTAPDDPAEIAFFLLSGGTTALPKLIARTHRDYLYQLRQTTEVTTVTAADTYLAALPVEFNFAWGCPGVLGTLNAGGHVVIADDPSPEECFELIAHHAVTFTSLVPTLAALWTEAREWDRRPLPTLRLIQIGGAKLEPALAAQIGPAFDAHLMQVFGMAEGLLSMTRLTDPRDAILTTQGFPISDLDETRIVDLAGQPVPPGQPGELLVRGPYTLRGYFRAEEHNRHAFTGDGFLRTGDLARYTPEGRLVICGRLKDVIIRGGEKINAPEVEEHLGDHPQVAAAACIPVPDDLLGERHCAFVTGATPPDLPQVRAWLRSRGLADYKLPDRVEAVHALPLTALGKVDKKTLCAAAADPSHPRPWNTPHPDVAKERTHV